MFSYSKWLAFALLFCLLAGPAQADKQLDQISDNAFKALQYMQKKKGLFHYEYDLVAQKYSKKNNMVRQAGTAYALGEYLLRTKSKPARQVLAKALNALQSKSIGFKNGKLVTSKRLLSKAKTGTTALSLLAELHYYSATGDEQFAEIRKSWKDGLLAQYRPGAGFAKLPKSDIESDYYNGETWLALAWYHALFPDDKKVGALLPRVDHYMMKRYSREPLSGFYHWGMLASAKRMQTKVDDKLIAFARSQTDVYLKKLRPEPRPSVNTCSAIEGLSAAVLILDHSDSHGQLKKRALRRIFIEEKQNFPFQIKANQRRLDLGNGVALHSPELSRFQGAFVNGRRKPRMRVDFTQHCLSAALRLSALRDKMAEKPVTTQSSTP
ncbi:MAG: hypothetical protein HQL54_12860 [Magnetococcales bacterium]|nr:hypothetical protein [Magnetococcales bacterium]